MPFSPHFVELGTPTVDEKNRVLQRLKLLGDDLDLVRQQHLQKANSWFVMMLEATSGEDLTKIVYDSVERLKRDAREVYHAYEYLCYAGQYNLSVPESLLASLNKDGYFYKIAEHPAAKGLIFSSGAKEDALSTLHPTIAHEALRVYRRDASILIREFIDAIDPDLRGQRIFLANLLYRLALDQQELFISKLLEQYAITIIKVLDASSTAELTNQWGSLYRQLNDQRHVAEIKRLAFKRPFLACRGHA